MITSISNSVNNAYMPIAGMPVSDIRLATAKAAEFIVHLQTALNVHVFESFARVEGNSVFHVLLFIQPADYLSAKMMNARVLSRSYAKAGDLDIKFSYCNTEETDKKSLIAANGFKPMQGECKPTHAKNWIR